MAYERLAAEMQSRRGGQVTRYAFGPSEPLHKDIDALAAPHGQHPRRDEPPESAQSRACPSRTRNLTHPAQRPSPAPQTSLKITERCWLSRLDRMPRTYPLPAGKLQVPPQVTAPWELPSTAAG